MTEHGGTSWNTHAILTRCALEAVDYKPLDSPVLIVTLEEFLATVGKGMLGAEGFQPVGRACSRPIDGQDACPATGEIPASPRPEVCSILGGVATVEGFLRALKLNPTLSIPYVRVLRPEEVPPGTPHSTGRSGPGGALRPGEAEVAAMAPQTPACRPSGAYLPMLPGESISAREILTTFSDEPDWGMDQDLFAVEEYEYGPVPFGPRTGPSSQAAFHMAFLHEPLWITGLWPGLRRSFMEERIEVFLALSRLAFDSRADYWGWRFLARAMHYLQDITQPYHARAFPPSLLSVLRRFVLDPHPKDFAARNSNLLRNHHFLFEAFVHYLLNRALKTEPDSPLLQALRQAEPARATTVRSLMVQCGGVAAGLAVRADRALMRLIDDPRIDRPDFSLAEGMDYDMDETIRSAAEVRPEAYRAFLAVVSRALTQAGGVTLYCLERVRSSSRCL